MTTTRPEGLSADACGSLTLQALQRFVLQGPGGQAPLDGGVTGADGDRHGRSLLLQREVQPVEEETAQIVTARRSLIHHRGAAANVNPITSGFPFKQQGDG